PSSPQPSSVRRGGRFVAVVEGEGAGGGTSARGEGGAGDVAPRRRRRRGRRRGDGRRRGSGRNIFLEDENRGLWIALASPLSTHTHHRRPHTVTDTLHTHTPVT